MDVFSLSEKDFAYVEDQIKHGIDVKQAFAQLEVLKHEDEFEQDILHALKFSTKVQDAIREIVRNG